MPSANITHSRMNQLVRRISFNDHLGIRLVRMHPDGLTISCRLRLELLNWAGVLHGGVTATMADVAVGMAVVRHFKAKRYATTVEMKLNYLRPVTGRKILARSRLVRVGSTLAIGTVDLHDDRGQLVAVALVTYMLLGNVPVPAKPVKGREIKARDSRGKSR